ncbi:outer membrane protein assembly factor BamE [Accumulibacter sp.]|uniref:outer membrane protein assembly factor BamE n=1 Tax=Accumulibacter sp. TaxID=2053492 RepID=UPI0025E5BC65|nr:outer membrane protein assembly factor BamE [Accumulibacter sp.]MCM8613928.1 outer membrane protein assembly factor BamE [Accumulibacter sp.]MCM8637685.1 outer membrane protein assembly factor BamE [Accumulibacter sp.]MCM8641101.1 outer membrane protein assembly factor BamE [Accumulibacter sp.]
MILPRVAVMAVALWTLPGCSSVPRIVKEYRIDVQQGNVLTQEMVAQLRPGLSRDQVRFVLGTPLLMDMFHANRWDYFYSLQKGRSGEIETRRLSVYFDTDGKLVRVSGDVAAAEPGVAEPVSETRNREIDLGSLPEDGSAVMPPPDEKGFFDRMMETVGF